MIFEWIAGTLIIIGAFFALVASVGLVRLPDIYSRMHAASKAGTVGSGLMMIALAIIAAESGTTIRALAGVLFFVLTAPIAAHLLARASYKVGYKLWEHSVADEMRDNIDRNFVWRNVMVNCGQFATRDRGVNEFLDNHAFVGDPGFADPEKRDFRLSDDSPIYDRFGFRPIPFDRIGLYEDENRASWPVKHEVSARYVAE